jgi:hypothetical protein
MTHATDGLLQAYLDGEIDSTAEAALREHLAACGACADELHEQDRLSARAHEALGVLDAPAPMLRAQAALHARRAAAPAGRAGQARQRLARFGAGSLARAAILLLVLAGAAAAAVPGSPLRSALENAVARVAQMFTQNGPAQTAPAPAPEPGQPAAAVLETASMAILPADGSIRVLLHAPSAPVDVYVRLVPESRAVVETATPDRSVRLRSGVGRVEVMGLSGGSVVIDIPLSVPNATVEVGGRTYVYKVGAALQLAEPAGRERGAAVSFRITP